MKLKVLLFIILFSNCFLFLNAQPKSPLNHSVYDDWKSISNQAISNDGSWITYEINPQEGDGLLFLYNTLLGSYDSIQRGYKAILSSNSNILVFNIKPQFDTVRAAKLKKVKKDKLPKDSLGIWVTDTDHIKKFVGLKSYKVPKEKSDWIAFLMEKPESKKDTLQSDTTKVKKKKAKGKKKKKATCW